MSDLPKGWVWAPFMEIADPVSDRGRRLKQSQYQTAGKWFIVDQGQVMPSGWTDRSDLVYDGPLPIIAFGDHTRSVRLLTEQFVIGAEGLKLFLPRVHDAKFLTYWLSQAPIPNRGYSRHAQFLKAMLVPLPLLPEQRRIVAEIEKQFTRLNEGELLLRNAVDRAKRLFASALAQATQSTGKGIPSSWRATTIGDMAEVGTGATPNRSKREYFDGGTIAWILSGAVNKEYVDEPSSWVTPRALAEHNLTIYPPGTLLIAMYGEGRTRGKVAELRIQAVTNQALAAIQLRPAFASYREYTRLALSAAYDDIRRRSSGGVQPNLNLNLIRSIKIYLPPASEVQSIVADLKKISSIVNAVALASDGSLAHASRLRQAILAKAFSGKLVPQNPGDEPATVLLERIRRERIRNNPNGRGARPRKRPEPALQSS